MSNDTRPTQVKVESRLRAVKSSLPEPVKVGIRGGARAAGWATSKMRVTPDFLIIGTKRGGTTSLWFAMLTHPDVMPLFPRAQELKSPHYFDINYGRGMNWYRSFFATGQRVALHQKRQGHRPIAGEASPYYMFHPLAAQRIASDIPEVKLLVSLRDPVERLWSHYNERFGSGTEILDIHQALDAESGRLAGEVQRIIAGQPNYYSFHHDLSSYLARGCYLEHLRPYLDRFGPDQLLILGAEDYYSSPRGELAKVARHLGIREFPLGPANPQHYNKLPRAQMPDAVRGRLIDYYAPHVAALESYLSRHFNWPNFTKGTVAGDSS